MRHIRFQITSESEFVLSKVPLEPREDMNIQITALQISALQVFPSLMLFWSDEKQIEVLLLSRAKTICTSKVIGKHRMGGKNIYILAPFACSPMSHLRRQKNFIRAAVLFGDNQSHLMVLAEHRICHKILEIDSKPSLLGWRNPIRLKNSEECWKQINSNGIDYWMRRI